MYYVICEVGIEGFFLTFGG